MNKDIEQQENFYKYLNIIRIGNKNDNQKKILANANILLMEEIVQSNLLKVMVQ